MQTQTDNKKVAASPVPFKKVGSDKMRIAQEASVRSWHEVNLKRVAEGKEPYDLAISNQAIGRELGLYPLDRSLAGKAEKPAPTPKTSAKTAPAAKSASVKAVPKAKAPAVAASKAPNGTKLVAADLEKAALAEAVKRKADKAEVLSKGKARGKNEGVPGNGRTKVVAREPELDLEPVKRAAHNRAPTLDAAEQFQKAFEHFNDALFKGSLEDTMIAWEIIKKGSGIFRPDRWAKARGQPVCHEINLNPVAHFERDTRLTLSTLVHEMCHLWVQQIGKGKVKPYHCKNWVKKMHEIGLPPIITDSKGKPAVDKQGDPKETGKNATHEIEKRGPFDEACKALLASGFDLVWTRIPDPVAPKSSVKKPKARIKFECPKCGEHATAKREMILTCGGCKKKMEPEPDEAELIEEGQGSDD